MAAMTVESAVFSDPSADPGGVPDPVPELHDAITSGTRAHHVRRSVRRPGRVTVKI